MHSVGHNVGGQVTGNALSWLSDQNEFYEIGDDTFELRQLLLSMTDVLDDEVTRPVLRSSTRDMATDKLEAAGSTSISRMRITMPPQAFKPKRDVAELLLKCIQKTLSTMRKSSIQRKLQNFVLEFCMPPPAMVSYGSNRPYQAAFERWVSVDECRLDDSRKLRPGNFVQPGTEEPKDSEETKEHSSARGFGLTNSMRDRPGLETSMKRTSAMAMNMERVSIKRMSISVSGHMFQVGGGGGSGEDSRNALITNPESNPMRINEHIGDSAALAVLRNELEAAKAAKHIRRTQYMLRRKKVASDQEEKVRWGSGPKLRYDFTGRTLKPGLEFDRSNPQLPVAISEKSTGEQWHLLKYFQRCTYAEISPLEIADPEEAIEFLAPDRNHESHCEMETEEKRTSNDRPQSAPLGDVQVRRSRRVFYTETNEACTWSPTRDEATQKETGPLGAFFSKRAKSQESVISQRSNHMISQSYECEQSSPVVPWLRTAADRMAATPDEIATWLDEQQSTLFDEASSHDVSSNESQRGSSACVLSQQAERKNAAKPAPLPRELPRADMNWWKSINAAKDLKPPLNNPALATGRLLTQACASEGVLPRKPDFVFHNVGGYLDLRGRRLSDAELRAIATCLSETSMGTAEATPSADPSGDGKRKVADTRPLIHTLLLDENRFGSEGVLSLLTGLRLEMLRVLSITRCPYVAPAVVRMSSIIGESCKAMRSLDLSGNSLSSSAFRALAASLTSMSQLETLGLADTGLGAAMQSDCIVVAESIGDCFKLEKLRLGGNHLHNEGCKALGEAVASLVYLEELDLSGNAGKVGSGCKSEPIDFFCETLSLNETLISLDVSYCQLGYGSAFILEESLATHPRLTRFSCCGNPLGTAGFECFVRYTMNPKAQVEWCDFGDMRDHPIPDDVKVFQALNPSGHYNLDLEQPLDRAILGRLLKWMDEKGVNISAGELAFQNLMYNGRRVKDGEMADLIHLDKNSNIPRWIVPQEGTLRAYFNAEFTLAGKDMGQVMQFWDRQRKVKVTLGRFVLLASLWRRLLVSEQHRMFIKAISGTCLLNMAQLRFLLEGADAELTMYIVEHLYPCVEASERTAILDVVKRPEIAEQSRKKARSLFFFNPSNPTGRYAFDLLLPVDHSTAERLLTTNTWQKFQAFVMNRPDISQHGQHECIRNACLDRDRFAYESRWVLPPSGTKVIFACDYSSSKRPSSKTFPILPDILDKMMEKMEGARCREATKLLALKLVADRLVLRPAQLLELVRNFRCAHFDAWQASGRNTRLSLTQQLQEGSFSARVEAFITCFNCVADRQTVCSPKVLYEADLFSPEKLKEIRERLGHLTVFDATNCCQLVQSNIGCRYSLDLSIHEDNRFMHMMVILGIKEDGENLVEAFWSEAAAYTEGRFFMIPATWIQVIPPHGTMSFKYVSEKPEFANYKARLQLGIEYLSWSNLEVPPDMEKKAYNKPA